MKGHVQIAEARVIERGARRVSGPGLRGGNKFTDETGKIDPSRFC